METRRAAHYVPCMKQDLFERRPVGAPRDRKDRRAGRGAFLGLLAAGVVALALIPATPVAAACGSTVTTGINNSAVALAQRCGTTVNRLRSANPGLDLDRPLTGQRLKVPGQPKPKYIPDAVNRGATPAYKLQSPVTRSHRPVDLNAAPRIDRRGDAGPAASQTTWIAGSATVTIRRGDTLSGIARANRVSLERLIAANPGVDPRRLAVGRQLALPR